MQPIKTKQKVDNDQTWEQVKAKIKEAHQQEVDKKRFIENQFNALIRKSNIKTKKK